MSRDQASFTVRLIDKVRGPAQSATKALDRLNAVSKRLQKTERAGAKLDRSRRRGQGGRAAGGGGGKSSFGGMVDVLGGNLMTAALSKVTSLAMGIASAGAEMVSFGQTTRLAFSNLAKHGADPEKLFEHSRALAKRFGLDVMETTDQYKKFLALQFDPKGADKLIRMGADLQALGVKAEDVQGVFTALGQIKGKGKLQGDEMLQLAERGISTALITEEIGKLMGGKSAGEVQKLQAAGKVTADIALEAIEKAINRKLQQSELGESGAKFADKTIAGMVGRAKALWQDSALTAVGKMAEPLTDLASKGITALDGFLSSKTGVDTINRIADGLAKAAEWTGVLATSFGDAFGETFTQSIKPLGAVFGLFGEGTTAAQSLGKALGEMTAFAVGVAGALGVAAGALGVVIGPIYEVGKAILIGLTEPFAGAIADTILWFSDIARIFGEQGLSLGEKAWAIGGQIVKGLTNGIVAVANLPVEALKNAGSAAIDALRGVFDIHSPSRVTAGIGVNVGKGLALGAQSTTPLLYASGDDMGTAQLNGLSESLYGPEIASARGRTGDMEGAPATGRGMGDVRINITQHIAGGSNPVETARETTRQVRRELEAFFRQAAMEAGA